jgi:hypothetical protein
MLSTNTCILPTAYLGPIEYYALLLQKNCSIEINDFFVKQSIRTRCTIYGANGKLSLAVPKIRKSSSKTLISDIKISYDTAWQKAHWKSLSSAYNSSPFFEYYADDLAPLFEKRFTYLIDLNRSLHEKIISLMQLSITTTETKKFELTKAELDYRNYTFDNQNLRRYMQVFESKNDFIPNLSILDLLFNEGTNAEEYLLNVSIQKQQWT